MPLLPAPLAPPADAVYRDVAQMALHMHQCAVARGRWFGLRSQLQHVSAVTAGRLVTVACIGVLLVGVLTAFT